MIRVLFICHGNICRSTMAEFYFKYLVRDRDDFYVDSAATSRDEIGSPVDRRTVSKLAEHGVPCGIHYGRQITKVDYEEFDYILLMNQENIQGIKRIIPEDTMGKIHLLLEYADGPDFRNPDGSIRDIKDPYYTLDFEATYKDIKAGCEGLIKNILQ